MNYGNLGPQKSLPFYMLFQRMQILNTSYGRQQENFGTHRFSSFHTPDQKSDKYSFFNHKLEAKYFHITQFFSQKVVFSEETAKNCSEGAFDHFF